MATLTDQQIADLSQRLDDLRAARDTGALSVRNGDNMTTFRSLDEINQIIADLENQLAGTSAAPPMTQTSNIRRVRYVFGKGL